MARLCVRVILSALPLVGPAAADATDMPWPMEVTTPPEAPAPPRPLRPVLGDPPAAGPEAWEARRAELRAAWQGLLNHGRGRAVPPEAAARAFEWPGAYLAP